MNNLIVRNARIVNEGRIMESDIQIRAGKFYKIGTVSAVNSIPEVDFKGDYLIPGIIDDQVHFREPGLTHKADIHTESKAAAAGGVTSYMEMPNTIPPATSLDILEEKYRIASRNSVVNYSFYLGAGNDNLEQLKSADYSGICGIKIFMGSSTGNLLVDNESMLEKIFEYAPSLIATHCEDETTIKNNLNDYKKRYGESITPEMHPLIRSAKGCYHSSSKAVNLAKRFNTRLHILHISTAEEIPLFSNDMAIRDKRITAEACVHHLLFDDRDYKELGNLIKCNPAIKTAKDRDAIRQAVKSGLIDVIATDHAPHTLEEKEKPYLQSPSGLPLVQHGLLILMQLAGEGLFTLEEIVDKTSHAPATCFRIRDRGFIREGYYADFVRLNLNEQTFVIQEDLHYKCGWSPLDGMTFPGRIKSTWVNGVLVFDQGEIISKAGMRLQFDPHF